MILADFYGLKEFSSRFFLSLVLWFSCGLVWGTKPHNIARILQKYQVLYFLVLRVYLPYTKEEQYLYAYRAVEDQNSPNYDTFSSSSIIY
jgi:hypothetical protein